MACERCGHGGITSVLRVPGRVPARAELCDGCVGAWNRYKAALFEAHQHYQATDLGRIVREWFESRRR